MLDQKFLLISKIVYKIWLIVITGMLVQRVTHTPYLLHKITVLGCVSGSVDFGTSDTDVGQIFGLDKNQLKLKHNATLDAHTYTDTTDIAVAFVNVNGLSEHKYATMRQFITIVADLVESGEFW